MLTQAGFGVDHSIQVIPIQELSLNVPLYSSVSAGFPSPADDYLEDHLDVNTYLVQNPTSTFFVRVRGDSMIRVGIYPDDILVVDRSLPAAYNAIIVAVIDNEFTVKRLHKRGNCLQLIPENPRYSPLVIEEGHEFAVWGIVTHVLHKPV
ncbi:LexA family transcriptional regulator [Lewinella sp. JB7]|uniref:LexA family protein n=1 Tax=Lewinella sp. JB7 TaxID=2962887 RepID=UPI0020C9B00F|nr:translesion error-prone DNA polymerase V autoproteolytic subunit [Lewinella sp. JB7]MCP9237913.1 translesion error-prone DNA polymerase V autoproteolytic subunit [Lewinella sp. JB7]